jgi:hypothetical protein
VTPEAPWTGSGWRETLLWRVRGGHPRTDRPATPSLDCQLVICGLVEGPVLSGNVPGTVQA